MATFFRTRTVLGVNGGAANALMTHYWDSTGAAPAALVTEAIARVRASLAALTSVINLSTTVVINSTADEIEETTGQIVGQTTGSPAAALAFTSANAYLPLQTQGLLILSTGAFVGGRRLKGRIFVPGLSQNTATAGGDPTPALLTAIANAGAALGTTVLTPMNQRVWSRPRAASIALPARAGLSAIVTSRSAGSKYGVLRSRRK